MPIKISWIALVYVLPLLLALLYLLMPLLSFSILMLFVLTALVIVFRPVWGGYLLVFFIPIAGNTIGFQYGETIFVLIIPLFGVILLMELIVLGIRKGARIDTAQKTANPAAIPVILFGIYAFLLFVWKSNAVSPVVFCILLINIVLFFYIFYLSSSSDEVFENIVWFFIAAGSVSALLTVFSVLFHPYILIKEEVLSQFDFSFSWVSGQTKYRGYSFELSNFTSRTLNLTTCLIVGKLLSSSKVKEILTLSVLLMLVVFANCLTSSKGGLGAFLVMMAFIILFSRKLNKNLFVNSAFFLAGFVLFYVLGIMFVSIVGEAFHATTLATEGGSFSATKRLEYWAAGIKMLFREDAFLTGLGLGGWENFVNVVAWPHSIYFSFFFDFGVFGLIFITSLVALVTILFFQLRLYISQQNRYEHMALCLFAGFLAIGIHGLVEFYYNQSIIWLYLALLFATLQMAGKQRERELVASPGPGETA